jgi:alpha-L-fucosidase
MMKATLTRRSFLKTTASTFAAALPACAGPRTTDSAAGTPDGGEPVPSPVPSYLEDHAELFARDPRAAAHAWFSRARFGLFMHYGLYSLLGRGEWVMFHEKIHVAEYAKLAARFDASRFDADFITDLVCDAGMRYVNLTARHHDSFCLFDSKLSEFTSTKSLARRDLVAELAEQCRNKKLGLFLYYSYALDWRHPYFYPRSFNSMARPAYEDPEPAYKWQGDADFAHYIDFVHGQLRELLTNYGPLAGIWFDPIMGYYARPDLFPIHETYALVRRLQPQSLISFKQGATGAEDFAAPERRGQSLEDTVRKRYGEDRAAIAARAWESNRTKHNEICDTMQPGAWGYRSADDSRHRSPAEVREMLAAAAAQDTNLLLNTGPLPDGTIHAADVKTLTAVGRRIRRDGSPPM